MLASALRRGLSARAASVIRCSSAKAASYLPNSIATNSAAVSKFSTRTDQSYSVRRSLVRSVSTHASLESDRVARAVSEKGKGWLEERAERPHFNFTERNAVKSNVVLMGPPGSGKSSVGRILSQKLSSPFLDIDDDFLEPHWGTTVANKLKSLGDEGFLAAEGEALQQLKVQSTVISLSGSNPLHAKSMEHVAKDATIFYLDIDPSEIVARCHRMKVDRIVGQSTRSLESILAYRRSIYENSYDVRIIVSAGETPESIAQRILTHLQRNTGKPNKYVSTRGYGCDGHSNDLDFLDVVQLGLSPDRGLFIPANLTGLKFSTGEFKRLVDLKNYEELQLRIMERFPLGSRIHPSELRRILYEAYSAFDHPAILPLVPLTISKKSSSSPPSSSFFHKHMYLMETFHGPTASFKDLSLQLLPKLLRIAMDKKRESLIAESKNHAAVPPVERVGLLVATSGDTGTAALDGFSRQEGVPVVVLYPSNGVSIVQKAQMQTTGGDVLVLGVDGDFDFCQTLVKDIFNDSKLKQAFRSILPNLILSSANSMNWGRFLPQIVFSIRSYLDLVRTGKIQFGDKVNLVVPTGNFGNILGGVYAKLVLGLPLNRIVCASNSNNILYDFLNNGSYDLRKRSFTQTISPSIDILVSSNLERFLHLLASVDAGSQTQKVNEEVKNYFDQLASPQKHFTVSERRLKQMKEIVVGGWANEQQCLDTIKRTFDLTGQYIDPHTAVAVHVANELLASDPDTPVVVSSTAHYGKFPNALCRAFHFDLPAGDSDNLAKMFEHLAAISPEAYRSSMHPQLAKLIDLPTLHNEHCAAKMEAVVQRIEQFFEKFAKRQ